MGSAGGDDDRLGNVGGLWTCVRGPLGAVPPRLRRRPGNEGSLGLVKRPSRGKGSWANRGTGVCTGRRKDSARSHAPQEREDEKLKWDQSSVSATRQAVRDASSQ